MVMAMLFFLLWMGFIFFIGFMWWKIIEKTGYHGALGLLLLVPVANIVMMAILAFKEWPIQKESQKELNGREAVSSGHLPASLILVIVGAAIVPIVLIIGLLAAIAIPNLLKARLNANEASAIATVRTISTAIETYAAANNGQYPLSEYNLKKDNYIPEYYDKKTKQGYVYSLDLKQNSYEIIAAPEECRVTGEKVFKYREGVLSTENCK